MPRTYFITGGAGNLACQLTFQLCRQGSRIILFDRVDRPTAPIAPGVEYICGDLTRQEEVAERLNACRPDVLLHFASLLSGSCEADRELAWRINMDGAFWLFEAALRAGIQTVFFPSSLATYGDHPPAPLPADFPQWPDSLYGVTKVAGERLGCYYHRRHGMDFRCIRLPMIISRRAPAGAVSAYASRAFVESVQRGGFTFGVNPQTRAAALYVKDVLDGIVTFLDVPRVKLTHSVYNIFGLSPSAAEIAESIQRVRPDCQFHFKPDPGVVKLIESWPASIDDLAARRDWGWAPKYDLDRLTADFLAELSAEQCPPADARGGAR